LLRGEGRFRSALEAHDVLFSFGLCLPGVLPPTGHTWIPTRQPVVLDEWRPAGSHRGVYTTVMNWASYDPERFNEGSFGQKDIEFAKFLDLPHQVKPARLEIAVRGMRNGTLPGASSSRKPADLIDTLRARGWGVVDATKVCATFEDYREHIRHSKAEWSIAKNAYVEGKAGWFSDRSACYLAAGRPVVVQDTGFGSVLPMGEGLLSFSTVREAVEATQSVERDYNRHCRAARRVAEEYFDSAAVLSTLIEQAFRSDTVEPHRQERSLC
jgi:hypothetical protein